MRRHHELTDAQWQLIKDLLPGKKSDLVRTAVADAAYDSDAIRKRAQRLRAKVCIRPNPTRRVRKCYDKQRYRHRNVIERFFGRIKRFRRVATRSEKKAVNFVGFVWLAAFVSEVF